MRIDLHTHSTASDGTLSPAELVRAAIAAISSCIRSATHTIIAVSMPSSRAEGRTNESSVCQGICTIANASRLPSWSHHRRALRSLSSAHEASR